MIQDLSTGTIVCHQIQQLEFDSARLYAASRFALSQVDPFSVEVLNYSEAEKIELFFLAKDVPPLGYKTYRILPETAAPVSSLETIENPPAQSEIADHPKNTPQSPNTNNVIENNYYTITVSLETGGLVSIFDKELQLELVDTSSQFHLNQLIARKPKSGDWTTSSSSSIKIESGKVFDRLIIHASCEGCPQISQEVTLYHGIKQIDFSTRLLRNSYAPLEILCAFPFAIDQPAFSYESNYGIIRPILDQLPGTNTDSYTIQHWLKIQNKEKSIAFSSPDAAVVYLGKMWSGSVSQAHLAALPPDVGRDFLRDPNLFEKGHIFSLMMINNFRTNFQPVQCGECLFRYSLTSSSPSAQFPWQFGWQVSQTLQAVILNQPQSGKLPTQASFIQLSEPDVYLLTMKAAENGDGLILRLGNFFDKPQMVSVTMPFYTIKKAGLTNLMEEGSEDLPSGQHRVKVPLAAGKITTIRCQGKVFPSVTQGLKL